MSCLLGCLALCAPRVTIVLLVIFSDFLGNAYETNLVPFLGFFFLPVTTIAYAWALHAGQGSVHGLPLAMVVLAALLDLGILGGGHAAWRRNRSLSR